jgi:hypothetical protein
MNNNEHAVADQFRDAIKWVQEVYPNHKQPEWVKLIDIRASSDREAINFTVIVTLAECDSNNQTFRYRGKIEYNILRDDQGSVRNKAMILWINLLRYREARLVEGLLKHDNP